MKMMFHIRYIGRKEVKEWIKKIPSDNLVITKYTKVCIKHFEEKITVDMRNFLLLVVDHPFK